MSTTVTLPWDVLDRMEQAVTRVRSRLLRASHVLNRAAVPYAVAGGNAVASWVATVDEGAVRTTPDVDILVRRDDLPATTAAFLVAGFVEATGLADVTFLDGPTARPKDAVHILFAGEKVRPEHVLPAPNLSTADDPAGFRFLTLEALVTMKLTSLRNKDQMHIRDLMAVGLLDQTWIAKLPPVLAERLQPILDTPDG